MSDSRAPWRVRWWSLFTLPVATHRERRLRRRMRVTACIVVLALGNMALMLIVFRRPELAAISAISAWLAGMVTAVWAVMLATAHFQGRRELGREGFRVCPGCEYDLSALATRGTCPECGRAYDPDTLRAKWGAIYDMLEKTPKKPAKEVGGAADHAGEK